jgi:hypothetical protein
MNENSLKAEILKEISRKAYELQIKSNLALNSKITLDDILILEKSIHHEIKKLRVLIHSLSKAKKKKDHEMLVEQIYHELNSGL